MADAQQAIAQTPAGLLDIRLGFSNPAGLYICCHMGTSCCAHMQATEPWERGVAVGVWKLLT
jgi:hypothetical protein